MRPKTLHKLYRKQYPNGSLKTAEIGNDDLQMVFLVTEDAVFPQSR